VLPVHDGAATLDAALASVERQTLEDFEVMVVCNGCTDRSEAVARRWARFDDRYRLEVLPEADIVAALNRGLEVATAPLVARLDADDEMFPTRLQRQLAALDRHPEWSLVACGVQCTAPDGAEPGDGMRRHVEWLNGLRTPDDIRRARYVDSPVAHPSVTARRDVLLEAGGYRAGPFPEDYDLWLRLLETGHTFGSVDAILQAWRDHPDRLTRRDPRCSEDAIRALKHEHLVAGPLRGRRVRVWGAGPFARKHVKGLAARGVAVEAMIDIDPRKVGRRVAGGVPVVSVDDLGPPDGVMTLLAVAAAGARAQIVDHLTSLGHEPERDYLAIQ
jgi:glycosyltransferase involved in cell wall biosynthesis